ncbi:probable methyltransferase PMT15 [Impatiens glandulifera]|uniref:probable methyltransferase PMT15 n=1 Tax=Impatiens glandulifera TaxID=253017 RepID=UPI001FB15727|nr:probable methyltransferase PMT15 [Impatiens glandulifera]
MKGEVTAYYTPTLKKSPHPISFSKSSNKIYLVLFITLLCSLSYFIGLWQRNNAADNYNLPCLTNQNHTHRNLDFSTHHSDEDDDGSNIDAAVKVYPPCDAKFSEYTPCEDVQRSLKFDRDRLIYRERHCPEKNELLKCRIPAPFGYKNPFKWPQSRDLAWYANVPHKELTVEKAVQNWIRYEGDRFRFPGGGTMFPNGANAYIDDIDKLINLKNGSIRTAIDTGCGVASWGSYLLSRDIIAVSFAPRDSHEAQVQFALERGVPALIGVMASKRLPYPSRAFDMAHCSRCLIPWSQYGGVYLMEVDRVLRPGGYWILSGPPIRWNKYWQGWERTAEDLNQEQTAIEKVAESLCWTKFVEKDDIAIWRKPTNHLHCKTNRKIAKKSPSFCPAGDHDKAWYTNMETCVTPLPEVSTSQETAGGKLAKWPARLNVIPPRVRQGTVQGVTGEIFQEENQRWKRRVSYYKTVNAQLEQPGRYRNLLDMNAHLGGFAAALIHDPVWVMNVVPSEAKVNTLGVVYERGLIGTYHSWCEAMSTYPRTYDLIHADSVFSLYDKRCEMEDIILEMDRILRPEGSVIIRDDVDMLVKLKRITDGMNWESQIVDHEDGPFNREKLFFAVKTYWTADPST